MDDTHSLEQAINESVALSTYDPAWPSKFDRELQRLKELCGHHIIAIEHIGSTAIPDMDAKPVIDIMASVKSIAVADTLLEILCNSGYDTSPEFNARIGNRRWLMRYEDGHRTHHLHLLEHNNTDWADCITFRDALRSNKDLALQYIKLKKHLMLRHRLDREAYSEGKSDFVRDVLDRYST